MRAPRLPLWVLVLAWCVAGCGAPQAGGLSSEDVVALHQRACQAKGQLAIERYKSSGWACSAIESYMRAFVAGDEDCKTFMKMDDVKICATSDAGADGGSDGAAE